HHPPGGLRLHGPGRLPDGEDHGRRGAGRTRRHPAPLVLRLPLRGDHGGAGRPGRPFTPLLSSFACAIPGIMAARVIDQKRDRMTTILVAPLMPCSARTPVDTRTFGP